MIVLMVTFLLLLFVDCVGVFTNPFNGDSDGGSGRERSDVVWCGA